jgi:dihydrofolate reductase
LGVLQGVEVLEDPGHGHTERRRQRRSGDRSSADPLQDLALMGRKTYEVLSDLPDEAKDEEWEKMTQQDTVVFSRTLTTVEWPNARVSDSLVVETKRLKNASDVPLRTVGSPTLVGQLVAAGLVDRLRLMTFPLFAGPDGREWAFTDIASADLELVEHRVLDGRVLLAEFHPTGKDLPRA